MRITVLNQFAKEMIHSDNEPGEELIKYLESTKWYLWLCHKSKDKAVK